MARIRSVKPALRTSRVVARWPFEVRYFWVLLWGYLDDKGRGLDMPKAIAGDCFPLDDKVTATTITRWLDLMATTKIEPGREPPLCRYEVNGGRYVHSVHWSEHQKPNRPSPSMHPPCPVHEGLSEPFSDGLSEGVTESGPDSDSEGLGPLNSETVLRGGYGDQKRGHGKVTNRDHGPRPKRTDDSKSQASRASPQVTGSRLSESPLSPHVLEFEGLTEGELEGATREPLTEPAAPAVPAQEPPSQCPKHLEDPDPPPCGACGKARRAHETWAAGQLPAVVRAAAEARQQTARARAEANSLAAAACRECDRRGYLPSGKPCPHDPDVDRAHRGAAAARAVLTRTEESA